MAFWLGCLWCGGNGRDFCLSTQGSIHWFLGSKGSGGAIGQPGTWWRSRRDGCQIRGQGWSELKPPLPGAQGGVTNTEQSCGNAQVPNNCQEMPTQAEVTSSILATVSPGSCGELTPIWPQFVFVYSSKEQWYPSNPVLHRRPSGASFSFKKLFILK